MTNIDYEFVVAPLPEEDGGGYVAYVPDLYGCMADGETPGQAATELAGAIDAWKAAYVKAGREVPKPGDFRQESEEQDTALSELLKKQSELIQEQRELIEVLRSRIGDLEKAGAVLPQRAYGHWASVQTGHGILIRGSATVTGKSGTLKSVKFAG